MHRGSCPPIACQIANKVANLRRSERRAAALRAELKSLPSFGPWVRPRHSEQELRRQLAETERNTARHRVHLAALCDAQAHGITERIALSRQTSQYRRVAIQSSQVESPHP